MIQRNGSVTDKYSRPVPGATVYVYNQDGTDATLTLDGTTPITEPITTDEWGGYSYFADDGLYREDIWFGGKRRAVDYNVAVGNPPQLTGGPKGNPGSPGEGYATRAAMQAAATSPTDGDDFYETETGGKWVYRAGNYASLVTADTAGGVYRRAGSIATSTGALVRKFDGPHNAKWFGLTGDGTTDNLAVWAAITAYFKALPASGYYDSFSGTYRPFPQLWIPKGHYYFSAPVELDGGRWDILCEGPTAGAGSNGVVFKIAPGNDGVVIQSWNTTGVNGSKTSRAETYGAQGSKIENLMVYTTGAGSGYTTGSGFYVRTHCQLINCQAQNFPGDGLTVAATAGAGGADEGNANGCVISGGSFIRNGGNGARFIGADVNASTIENITLAYNAKWGVLDSSFLGIFPHGLNATQNGYTGAGPTYALVTHPAVCSDGTYRYYIIEGQEANASTTAPTSGASNAVWGLLGTGASDGYYFPLWTTGQTWKSGGAYASTNSNSQTVFRDCYGEGDNAPGQMGPRGTWDGGIAACGSFGALIQQVSGIRLVSGSALGTRGYGDAAHGTTDVSLGSGNPNSGTVLSINNSLYNTTWGTQGAAYSSFYKDLMFGRAGNGTNPILRWTTDQTTFNPGRSATVPDALIAYNLFIGTDNAARSITSASAAPTTGNHGQGDIVFNNAPTAGGKAGWICMTAGAPGTWKAWGVIDA